MKVVFISANGQYKVRIELIDECRQEHEFDDRGHALAQILEIFRQGFLSYKTESGEVFLPVYRVRKIVLEPAEGPTSGKKEELGRAPMTAGRREAP